MRQKLMVFFTALLLVLLSPAAVFGQTNFRSGDSVSLGANEVVKQDYFAAGSNVSLDGTVDGDAYLAGGNISVNGTVNGDLLVAGGNVNLNGTVTGNIRAAGGNLVLSGKVGRNVSVAGGSLTVSPAATIAGNLTVAGGQVNVESKINGNIIAAAGQLGLGSLARVDGEINYWSNTKATVSPGASVSGAITQFLPPKTAPTPRPEMRPAGLAGVLSVFKILGFLVALIVGLVFLRLFPVFTARLAGDLTDHWLLNLGVGLIALAITPFLLLGLLVTIIGIPLIAVWLFFLVVGLWLAKIFVALAVGLWLQKYFKQSWGIYLAFFLGLVAFSVIGLIPLLGGLIGFLAALAGLGALIRTKKAYYFEFRQKKLI